MNDEIDLDEIADRRDRQDAVRKQSAKWIKRQRKAQAKRRAKYQKYLKKRRDKHGTRA